MAKNNGVRANGSGSAVELIESLTQEEEPGVLQAPACCGHLAGVDDEGRVLFRRDNDEVAFPVSIGMALSDDELVRASWLGQRALVVQTADDTPQFVLVSLLRERVADAARDAVRNGVNVKIDGEDVHLTAKNEIELLCGKARLLLRKDGRIEISGTSITSRSRGPVKIKGATIALN